MGEETLELQKKLLGPKHPDTLSSLHNLATFYYSVGRLEEAILRYRRVIELNPRDADAVFDLGLALMQQGKTEEEIESFRKVIELDPDLAAAHMNLGLALIQQGKKEEGIRSYRRAVELDPGLPMVHYNLGIALFNQGRTEEAIDAYRRAIEVDPENSRAHCNLGVALDELGKTDEAIVSYRRAIELDPKYALAHNNLAYCLAELGQAEEAIEIYRRAIELDPKLLSAIANLASVHAKLGQVDRCGVWCVRWCLASGLADEASLERQTEECFHRFKDVVPAEDPTDLAVREYYEANKVTFSVAAVHLRTLSMPKATATRKFAGELRDNLVAGGNFAAAAKEHSDDLAAADGGDRGWVKRGDLRVDLLHAAFALDVGEISAVVEDNSHYRILSVVERRTDTPAPLTEMRQQIVEELKAEARTVRIKGWIEQAKKELEEGE